ncbi:MAG: NAD(P)-dependent oxidoreductase [Bryobacteraceae bacterium]
MTKTFRVGLTRDFLSPDGKIGFGDIGLSLLEHAPGVSWEFLAGHAAELTPEHVAGYDAVLVLAPKISAATLEGADRLAILARFGVGYDNVDVDACTRNGVALTITPDGVRRPVAVSAITFMLALSHKLLVKDKLTREGRWAQKIQHNGMGVTGRTLGVVGLGNIGLEVCKMAKPFEMKIVGYDPMPRANDPRIAGVEQLPLDELLRVSDYVCICCALTAETRHLIDERRLGLMKQTAYLINVARGPVVEQVALTKALRERRIQGAGLDVFDVEPISPTDELLTLDNVILAPHAICWTDELFRNNGTLACQSILDVAAGRVPSGLLNTAVAESAAFRAKLERYR